MKTAINVREEVAQEARVLSVAAAEMIRAGEPVVAGPSTIANGLETNELAHLVDDGYDPDPAARGPRRTWTRSRPTPAARCA